MSFSNDIENSANGFGINVGFAIDANLLKLISQCEKKLSYLIKVTNSLFSYGLPTANYSSKNPILS
jgi:hypothetical protein